MYAGLPRWSRSKSRSPIRCLPRQKLVTVTRRVRVFNTMLPSFRSRCTMFLYNAHSFTIFNLPYIFNNCLSALTSVPLYCDFSHQISNHAMAISSTNLFIIYIKAVSVSQNSMALLSSSTVESNAPAKNSWAALSLVVTLFTRTGRKAQVTWLVVTEVRSESFGLVTERCQ